MQSPNGKFLYWYTYEKWVEILSEVMTFSRIWSVWHQRTLSAQYKCCVSITQLIYNQIGLHWLFSDTWGVKDDFTFALHFFLVVSNGLGSVTYNIQIQKGYQPICDKTIYPHKLQICQSLFAIRFFPFPMVSFMFIWFFLPSSSMYFVACFLLCHSIRIEDQVDVGIVD